MIFIVTLQAPRQGMFGQSVLRGLRCALVPYIAIVSCLMGGCIPHPATNAISDSRVWFSPDNETPDLLQMFTQPNLWTKARRRISVFKLGSQHFEISSSLRRNSFADLQRVKAFDFLKKEGISLAIEEGAVKEWDCYGHNAAKVTLRHLSNADQAHAQVNFIAMDEPLVGGMGACGLSIEEVAKYVSAYISDVTQTRGINPIHQLPLFGDIEPYPSKNIQTLIAWIEIIGTFNQKLAFFHLDIDQNFLSAHPEIGVRKDIQILQQLLQTKGIPFGIIIWSGYDPVESDTVYYDDAMRFAHQVKSNVRLPMEIVFQSWVRRGTPQCRSDSNDCPSDKCESRYCGEKSVPFNLPESGPMSRSHTRLVNDVLALLEAN